MILTLDYFLSGLLSPDERLDTKTTGPSLSPLLLVPYVLLFLFALFNGSTAGVIMFGFAGVATFFFGFIKEWLVAVTTDRVIAISRWPGRNPDIRIIPVLGSSAQVDARGGLIVKAANGERWHLRFIGWKASMDLAYHISSQATLANSRVARGQGDLTRL